MQRLLLRRRSVCTMSTVKSLSISLAVRARADWQFSPRVELCRQPHRAQQRVVHTLTHSTRRFARLVVDHMRRVHSARLASVFVKHSLLQLHTQYAVCPMFIIDMYAVWPQLHIEHALRQYMQHKFFRIVSEICGIRCTHCDRCPRRRFDCSV